MTKPKPKVMPKRWIEPRLSSEKVAELALGIFRGQIFTSAMVCHGDFNILSTIFMPLGLLPEKEIEKLRKHFPTLLYGQMEKALPSSINGYPIFMEMGMVYEQDAKLVKQKYDALVVATQEILKPQD